MRAVIRVIGKCLLSLAILASLPCFALAYEDTSSHWATKEIDLLAAKGIVSGYEDGNFHPDRGISRAELSKVIISALNLGSEAYSLYNVPSYFADVSSDNWAKGYIDQAYELGIITGYEDGTFRPASGVNRVELTAILLRALEAFVELDKKAEPVFEDASRIPSWAEGIIKKALGVELVSGYPDNTFRPQKTTTRAEAVVLLVRMLEMLGDSVEFSGTLKSINLKNSTLKITLDGEDYDFGFNSGLRVYDQDRAVDFGELLKQLPQDICFVVNSAGLVPYLERADLERTDSLTEFNQVNKLDAVDEAKTAVKPDRTLDYFSSVYTGTNPGGSIEITKAEMGLGEFGAAIKSQGSNQVIAIIDTGVDPGHPDLLKNPKGETKIVDWVDFTDEFKIELLGSLSASEKNHVIAEETYLLKDVPSKSGRFHYGFIEEGKVFKDLNLNGKTDDKFLLVLSDPEVAGQYDTVFIDLHGNKNLEGKGYKLYREEKQYFSLKSSQSDQAYNLVVGAISPDADWVKLGADFNGHGTHVAGIASANGQIQGVAPASNLMVLKALDTMGETDWDLLKEAIVYAADHGANIINLSLGYYFDDTAGNNILTELISRITREKNIVFTVATGNKGPGLASLATPGNAKEAISVGAFISPAMWKADYGWTVEKDSLWYFSSIGPRKDGLMIPDVVAPGSVISTAPMWAEKKYSLAEGTSMAAPHVAGVVALLMDSLNRFERYPDAADIRRAISLGARALDGYGPAEVGAGVIDAAEAWRMLFLVNRVEPLLPKTYNRKLAFGEGLYARDFIPAELDFAISNLSDEAVDVKWDSTAYWLVPNRSITRIAAGGKRTVPVTYYIPEQPGLYSAFLLGDIASSYGYDLMALATIVRPFPLSKDNNYTVGFEDELPAAQFARYFFKVPPGAGEITMALQLKMAGSTPKGRVRAHLIDPNGDEYYMTEYIGLGPPGAVTKDSTAASISFPEPGIWEVVVYSSAGLSEFGAQRSSYDFKFNAAKLAKDDELSKPPTSWIIGGVAAKAEFNGLRALTCRIIDQKTKKAVNGVLELNGAVYEVHNGRLFLQVE